jgi:hypothetical protein
MRLKNAKMPSCGKADLASLFAGVMLAGLAGGASAQSIGYPSELAHCLSLTGAAARLSCYDRLAREAGGAPARATGNIPPTSALPNPQTNAGQPELGREELSGGAPKAEARVGAEIIDFRMDRNGRFTVTLSNGQVWQQIAGDTAVAQYRAGRTLRVVIAAGSVGSYDLYFNDQNAAFKVRRLH